MKRRPNRIALPSCWEQLRTGKAWRRLSLALLVAVMTMTAQTAWAQTSGQQQNGEAQQDQNNPGGQGEVSPDQPIEPEQLEVEVTVAIVIKLLYDINKTSTDKNNTGVNDIANIVYQNIPEGSDASSYAQTTQQNVSLTGDNLTDLKNGLEANNTAVISASTITGNLNTVNELVEVIPTLDGLSDPKIFQIVDGNNTTTIKCINAFGDRASSFDGYVKLANEELQTAQNAASDTEAVSHATSAKNYLNNAASALVAASSLITSAETVISTARTDLTRANSAFTGASKRDLDNMQESLLYAKNLALDAKKAVAEVKNNIFGSNNQSLVADVDLAVSKTADLYNEIARLKVSSAPGGAALAAVDPKITGLEENVSWARQCLAIMQERYNTLNEALTLTGLLPQEPDPVSYIDENGKEQSCLAYTELKTGELPSGCSGWDNLPGGWYVVNSNVTVDGRINLTGDTNLILGDGYTLDVKGIYIPQGSMLTIYAQSDGETAGKIVSRPTSGAAIGGKTGYDNGNIVIYGGIIEATGADHCTGIGSNDGQTGGTITIYGGTVTAKGGADAAAIGGGRNCSGGTITIYGGTITTDSDPCENGAGIGGGDGGDGGTITIYGGTITTYSRDGAGIGGGDDGNGGTITINGGTITSIKVNQGQGARIGGGCDAAPGTITINGGTITTEGGSGAGIGGGKGNLAGGTVTINGGVINASGSYGIGAGENGADVAITLGWTNASDYITASSYNGTVTIAAGKMFTDGTNIYDDETPSATLEALTNKTLQPITGVTLTKDGSGELTATFSGTTEDEVSIPVNVTVDNVTIDRTFTANTACTLYLPFSIAVGKVSGGTFNTFTGVNTSNPAEWIVEYSPVTTGNIAANTPYIFLPNGDNGGKIVVNNGEDKITVGTGIASTQQTSGDWEFIGTHKRIKWTHDTSDPEYTATREAEIGSIYGFAANNIGTDKVGDFVKVGNNVWINPMRAYLKNSSTSSARAMAPSGQKQELPDKMKVVIISANGTTTEIGTLDTRTGEISLDEWYSLDGRKLSCEPAQHGVYIHNGKKVKK